MNAVPTINGSAIPQSQCPYERRTNDQWFCYTLVTMTSTNAVPTIIGSVIQVSVTTTRMNAVPTNNGSVLPQSQRPVRAPYQRLMVLLYLSHNNPYKRRTNY